MNNDNNQDLPTTSAAQEAAVIDVKQTIAEREQVNVLLGRIEAFNFISKLTDVGSVKMLAELKESKQYKGITYFDADNNCRSVGTWDEFCTHKLHSSRSTIDERIINLNMLGESFLEVSQNIGLGVKDLRKLRQLPEETQQLIINNESVDLGDKEAVKELIEDFTFKQVTEKAELQKQLDEANETVEAVRENSAVKQQELDKAKELEAKRRFSQEPWKHQTMELAQGMINAKLQAEQAVNQMLAIFEAVKNPDSDLDEKAIELCGRSLMAEAIDMRDRAAFLLDEVAGIFGGIFEPDMTADDAYLEANDIEPLQE